MVNGEWGPESRWEGKKEKGKRKNRSLQCLSPFNRKEPDFLFSEGVRGKTEKGKRKNRTLRCISLYKKNEPHFLFTEGRRGKTEKGKRE
jgi:hypothetical protein